jgi:hypothetical protein
VPDPLTGGDKGALKDSPFVLRMLQKLDALERHTRPSSGVSAHGKDFAAFEALSMASWLVQYVAGWAIDHQRGLAERGLRFVPRGNNQTQTSPHYLERRAEVDQHEHEINGDSLNPLEPAQARLFVFNMLRAMHHLKLPSEIVEALEALDYGQTLPILEKTRTSKRMGLVEYRAKLVAICYIEYQYKKGIKKYVSMEDVANAFGATRDVIKDWPVEVRAALGNLEVERMVSMSRNLGGNVRKFGLQSKVFSSEIAEDRVGKPALLRAGERYKARSRKPGSKTSPKKRG